MNCKICDKYFSGIVPFQAHEASEKHKRKVQLHKLSGLNADSLQPQSSQTSQTQVASCPACSKSFSDLSEFFQHTMSEEHALKVIEKMEANSEDGLVSEKTLPSKMESTTADLKDNTPQSHYESNLCVSSYIAPYYSRCEACQKNFSGPEPYQQHIDSAAHKKKCAIPSQAATSLSVNKGILKCDPCGLYFTGSLNYDQHMAGAGHRKKVLASSNQANSVPNSNGASSFMITLRCEICDIVCSGPAPFDQHLSSENHKKFVARHHLLSNVNEAKENAVVDGPMAKTSLMSKNLSPWYCEICDIHLSGPEPLKQHMEGIKHAKKAVVHGKESNRAALQKLLFGDPNHSQQPVQQFSTTTTQVSQGASKVANDLGDEIQNSIFGNGSYIKNVTPSNLDIAVFKVGEAIDFDENSTGHIQINSIDMCQGEDENDVKNDDDLLMDDDDSSS